MPIIVYRKLSDNDAAAIAAYLHSLPPIHNPVGRTQYKIPLPPSWGPPVTQVAEPARDDKVGYGRYLATFGYCMLCHTAPSGGQPLDMSHAFAGGRELPNADAPPTGLVISRNITSDPEQGIGKWSDEQIKRALVEASARMEPSSAIRCHTLGMRTWRRLTLMRLSRSCAHCRQSRRRRQTEAGAAPR